MAPNFITAPFKINLAVDNAIANVEGSLDSAIGVENATATAKLDAALASVAVRSNEVDAVLEGSRHPATTGRLIIQPISREQNNIRTVQSAYACRFKIFRVHTNECSQAAQRRFPYGHTDVAITRPAGLRNVGVDFAICANDFLPLPENIPLGANQGNTVVVNVRIGVNFGEADGDVAVLA